MEISVDFISALFFGQHFSRGDLQLRQKDQIIQQSFTISHLHMQIFLQLGFSEGDQIFTLDPIVVECSSVLTHIDHLQKIHHLLDVPFLDVFLNKLKPSDLA